MSELTEDVLEAMRFRGPVAFFDGRGGMAQQDFEAVGNPRFGYSWRRGLLTLKDWTSASTAAATALGKTP